LRYREESGDEEHGISAITLEFKLECGAVLLLGVVVVVVY
jgi:hypothetical protein